MKLLLILGSARSGTTLLASMMGRHSEISMLNESLSKDVYQLVGKIYSGNKITLNRRMTLKRRRSRIGQLIFFKTFSIKVKLNKYFFRKIGIMLPVEQVPMLSIQSYLDQGAKIVLIERDKEAVLNSHRKRYDAGTEKSYEKDYEVSMEIIHHLEKNGCLLINYGDLVKNPSENMQKVCDYLELDYEERMLEGPSFNPTYKGDSFIDQQ